MGFTEPELYESDESLLSSALKGMDVEELRERGVLRLSLPEDFRPYAEGGFPTASGRIELSSEALVRAGHPALPTYTPAREGLDGDPALLARYPLALLTPKHHTRFLNSSYSHLPKHGPLEGGPFVELDEADASARGIVDGDTVQVWNDRGALTLTARLSKRLRPGVVAVPFGWWSGQHGGDGTANSLTNDTLTDWGGGVAYSDTLVQVAAVTTPA
jgi:anaerobic selenocysteine-containing dehydrogenase